MQVVYSRCCGLDVHKRAIAACVLLWGAAGQKRKEVRSFGTMTRDLLALGDWLRHLEVTHVAMESTGVYWKPVWNVLEGRVSEDANLKLASVATDILAPSGRSILRALLAGQEDPEQLAELAQKRLRAKIPELRRALEGRLRARHVFLLRRLLEHLKRIT